MENMVDDRKRLQLGIMTGLQRIGSIIAGEGERDNNQVDWDEERGQKRRGKSNQRTFIVARASFFLREGKVENTDPVF